MSAKMSVGEYLEKYNSSFVKFGRMFAKKLTDESLISALAEKDLEKLAKVWKLVFEMLSENSDNDKTDKLAELISAYVQPESSDPDKECDDE